MAKLTRIAIKSIVKECLIEILQEGLMSKEVAPLKESIRNTSHAHISENRKKRRMSEEHSRRLGLDKIGHAGKKRVSNESFENSVKETAKSLTSDPVLSSILEDTAKTTLQEQIVAEQSGPNGISIPTSMAGDEAARTVAMSTPEDLFGDSAGKWADLAFSGPVNRPQN